MIVIYIINKKQIMMASSDAENGEKQDDSKFLVNKDKIDFDIQKIQVIRIW